MLAAARVNIFAIDTPVFDINKLKKLKLSCRRAKQLGFIGKIALHPKQVAIINKEFSPSQKEITCVKEIIAASEKTTGTICVVAGKMIGPPMIKTAKHVLDSIK